MAKITLKYTGGNIPENLSELLSNADEQDMRILIALMMAADADGEIADGRALCDMLGAELPEIEASLKFWRGAGIVSVAKGAAKRSKSENTEKKTDAPKSAHRDGAVEKTNGVSPYATEELAALFEKRRVTAQFIDEAQRVTGRTFNSYDTGIVAGIVDQLGFEEEAVLHILAYSTRLGKKGLRYAEKLAISFYDEGITASAEVGARIARMEQSAELIGQIKTLFGAGGRELSKTEKTLFEKWIKKLGYDVDVIRLAYDITIDNIQKPAPKYTDAILEKWYAEGLRTAEDVERFEKDKKQTAVQEDKSYDLDDFYEAALERSFKDLK